MKSFFLGRPMGLPEVKLEMGLGKELIKEQIPNKKNKTLWHDERVVLPHHSQSEGLHSSPHCVPR